MKRENRVSRIITIVLGLFLFAYIAFQAYNALYNPVRTTSAVYTEVDDAVEMEGYVIRAESVMTRDYGSGVLEMSVEEGEKVANGSAVAVVYADEASAEKSRDATALDEQINRMTTLYSQSGENYDIDAANDKISEYSITVAQKLQENVFEDIGDSVEEMKLLTLVREYMHRDKTELLDVIDGLRNEKNNLLKKVSVKRRIYANQAGYFSQYADGYENVFVPSMLSDITVENFEALDSQYASADRNAMGKLIKSNIWYYAATVSEKEAARFKEGKTMTLKFDDRTLPKVNCEVIRVSDVSNGKALVVFECNTHIGDFTKVRKTTARAVVYTYTGLKVPREALRVSDEGQNGVYCLIDSQVKFKPIEIIFEKDSYYIAKYDTSDTKSLLLYDEIVISAKNLENKKVIK